MKYNTYSTATDPQTGMNCLVVVTQDLAAGDPRYWVAYDANLEDHPTEFHASYTRGELERFIGRKLPDTSMPMRFIAMELLRLHVNELHSAATWAKAYASFPGWPKPVEG